MQGLLADLLSERTKYLHDTKVNQICSIFWNIIEGNILSVMMSQ